MAAERGLMPDINECTEVMAPWPGKPAGLFITDLDGTLLRSDRTLSGADAAALLRLAERRVVRVVATGRSLFSFNTVPVADLPVDFIIFSTGAGVAEHPGGRVLRGVSLQPAELRQALDLLRRLGLDFMVHRAVPESHVFAYHAQRRPHPDFERRLEIYRRFAFPLDDDLAGFGPAAQLVAIIPQESTQAVLEAVRRDLGSMTVIRTTSPLDGQSTWIEIFPAEVSKSRTADWLASRLGIPRQRTLSVGNDYNDLDLLEWAHTRFVVANAPADLRARFPGVRSNNEGGVNDAISRWLAAVDIS
jgi:hydroxymethylpyrimidine pyrophosphatase-like HAD family hydrolase